MHCPKCKAQSVVTTAGLKECKSKSCTYIDRNPISFANDVRHYEDDDKNKEDRYSMLYHSSLQNGGIGVQNQNNDDKNMLVGQKKIKDICYLFKYSQKIQLQAEARFISIYKLKIQGAFNKSQEGKGSEEATKKIYSVVNLACYSIYSACFENEFYFQDYRLSNWIQKENKRKNWSYPKWKSMVKTINNVVKDRIDFIPVQRLEHHILRVCKCRKIAFQEQKAMEKMCEKVLEAGLRQGHSLRTVAACIFWKIMENSEKYCNKIRLSDICRKHDSLEACDQLTLQKYFDCSPDTVKKYAAEKIDKDLYKYLPKWEGMIKK